jgi:8-oxo-dGTP pyrophosphatase MutT (NUDIX family)
MIANNDKIIDRILYGIDAVVFHPDGRVLMLNRDPEREDFATGWEFIKGGVKQDETWLEAALREISEEANVEVEYLGALSNVFEVDARYRKKPHYDFVRKKALVFLHLQGDVSLKSGEHTDWQWMLLDKAKQSIWVENGKEILDGARRLYDRWLARNTSLKNHTNQ